MQLGLFLSLGLLICMGQGLDFFGQVEFNVKTGAMCMDGSPYSIYTYTPDPLDFTPANKVLIYFEEIDFGWCMKDQLNTSLHECYQFITQDALIDSGSSINWPSNVEYLQGVLSWTGGGYFTNWHKVIIKSCDGGSFLGNTTDPIKYRDKKLHFRGSQNVMQAVTYLNKINWLKNREEVVLIGSFNAGIATLLWSDYFKAQTNGKFRVIADGSLFLNTYNYRHNATYIEERMRMV